MKTIKIHFQHTKEIRNDLIFEVPFDPNFDAKINSWLTLKWLQLNEINFAALFLIDTEGRRIHIPHEEAKNYIVKYKIHETT